MKSRFPASPRAAFSLVEVTLSLGIIAFCLVTLVGLLPVGLNSNQAALQQTAAAAIAQAVVADLRSAPPTSPTSSAPVKTARYNVVLPPAGVTVQTFNVREDASLSLDNPLGPASARPGPDARYRVSLEFLPPPGTGSKAATLVLVLVVWPPAPDSAQGKVPTRYSGSVESCFALDRN